MRTRGRIRFHMLKFPKYSANVEAQDSVEPQQRATEQHETGTFPEESINHEVTPDQAEMPEPREEPLGACLGIIYSPRPKTDSMFKRHECQQCCSLQLRLNTSFQESNDFVKKNPSPLGLLGRGILECAVP